MSDDRQPRGAEPKVERLDYQSLRPLRTARPPPSNLRVAATVVLLVLLLLVIMAIPTAVVVAFTMYALYRSGP